MRQVWKRPGGRCVFATLAFIAVVSVALPGAGAAGAGTTVAIACTTDPNALATALASPSLTDGTTLAITGTCTGTFELTHSLTLAGSGAAVLDGQAAGTVLIVDAGETVNVSGLTITNGSGGAGFAVGGVANFGTLTLSHSSVSGNSVASFIAVSAIDNAGSLTLTHSSVSGNTVVAAFDSSGAIRNRPSATLTLTHTHVSGNVTSGAFFAVSALDNLGSAALIQSSVSDNTVNAQLAFGSISGGGTLTITGSTVSGNSADGVGIAVGGINVAASFIAGQPSGTLSLTNSSVSGNSASASSGNAVGGILDEGAFVPGTAAALTKATNSTVSGNTASAPAGKAVGGISEQTPGTVTLTNTVVVDNIPINCDFSDPACA